MSQEQSLFQQAFKLQQNKQFPQAIALYEKILQKNPIHLASLHYLGLIQAQLGDQKSAINYLQQAIALAPDDPNLHNSLGNAFRQNNQPQQAIEHYEKAIRAEPSYAQAHGNLADIFAMQNQFDKALSHYREAVHAAPDFAVAHYHLGLLLLKNQRLQEARTQFNNVLALNPEHLDALFYLGVISLNANQLPQAERAFQNVLLADHSHAQALSNLGVIALKRDHGQLAVDYFSKALAYDNNLIDARNNLAATFMHYDRFENALTHYDYLLKEDPDNIEYLYNTGVAQMALGRLQEAIGNFEHLLRKEPEHFAALNNLAAIYIRLEDRQKAGDLLRKAVKINKTDAASQHMLHALEGEASKAETCSEYAENLFNNYSLYYDKHMQETLHYTLPQHVKQICAKLNINHVDKALDLGCGTGLLGDVLRPLCKHLTGVDIAEKMLRQAENKQCYDALKQAEIMQYLKRCKTHYGLITLIDVLPYFGDLQQLFTLIYQHLAPKGLVIFSTEISTELPWQLQETGRFCHHPDSIKNLCNKLHLKIIEQSHLIARQQNDQDLAENLFVAQR